MFMFCAYIVVLSITFSTGTNWGSFDRRFQLTENETRHKNNIISGLFVKMGMTRSSGHYNNEEGHLTKIN